MSLPCCTVSAYVNVCIMCTHVNVCVAILCVYVCMYARMYACVTMCAYVSISNLKLDDMNIYHYISACDMISYKIIY